MKTICILSYQRTGSSWLCDILAGDKTIGLQEIFSKDPICFIQNIYQVLNKIYKVEPSILNTLYKIYYPSNFFIDSLTYIKIKDKILIKEPYSLVLLKDIQNISYKYKYNVLFKIFPEHLDLISLQDINRISDIKIINYRNNLLDSFISEKKALISQKWSSLQEERKYLSKIEWNEEEYIRYVDKVIKNLNYFLNNIDKYVLISYEEIHNKNNNSYNIIYNKIKNCYPDCDLSFKQESKLKKENYIKDIANNFINQKQFILSYNHIRTKIYE